MHLGLLAEDWQKAGRTPLNGFGDDASALGVGKPVETERVGERASPFSQNRP